MDKKESHKFIQEKIKESILIKQKVSEQLTDKISVITNLIIDCLKSGNKVMFCGNGGSAADSQHLAAEFVNQFRFVREPLAGIALTTDSSILTCVGNDSTFDHVFSKQVKAIGKPGDIMYAISTSGNSKNVIEACKVCKTTGIKVIGLTGENGGKLKEVSDVLISVPSSDTARVQESHILIGHIMCEIVEREMFK